MVNKYNWISDTAAYSVILWTKIVNGNHISLFIHLLSGESPQPWKSGKLKIYKKAPLNFKKDLLPYTSVKSKVSAICILKIKKKKLKLSEMYHGFQLLSITIKPF